MFARLFSLPKCEPEGSHVNKQMFISAASFGFTFWARLREQTCGGVEDAPLLTNPLLKCLPSNKIY